MAPEENQQPAFLYKQLNPHEFLRFDPAARPGSRKQYVIVPASLVPPLTLADDQAAGIDPNEYPPTHRARLSLPAPGPYRPLRPNEYRRL